MPREGMDQKRSKRDAEQIGDRHAGNHYGNGLYLTVWR